MSYNRLSSYATCVFWEENHQVVVYHSTRIVRWNATEIILNSGGWQTATTKKKMNQAANQFHLDFTVYQEDFNWYVTFKNEIIPFENNMVLAR